MSEKKKAAKHKKEKDPFRFLRRKTTPGERYSETVIKNAGRGDELHRPKGEDQN